MYVGSQGGGGGGQYVSREGDKEGNKGKMNDLKSLNENDRRILGVCILFVTQTTWTYSVEAKTNDAYSPT